MRCGAGIDYTVFLPGSAKERWDASGGAREAAVEGIAISGPVITAAAAVMVAVYFTFALSGPPTSGSGMPDLGIRPRRRQ